MGSTYSPNIYLFIRLCDTYEDDFSVLVHGSFANFTILKSEKTESKNDDAY